MHTSREYDTGESAWEGRRGRPQKCRTVATSQCGWEELWTQSFWTCVISLIDILDESTRKQEIVLSCNKYFFGIYDYISETSVSTLVCSKFLLNGWCEYERF